MPEDHPELGQVGPLKLPPAADPDALAQATASETESAIPPRSAAASDGQAAAGPVDRWGRPFDPALHHVKPDGSPALYRNSSLITRKGCQPVGAKLARRAPAASTLGGEGELEAGAEHGAPAAAQAPAQQGAVPGPQPGPQHVQQIIFDPEEMERRARADGKAVRTVFRLFGRWLAGADDGEYQEADGVHEGDDIEGSAHDLFLAYGIRLPFGAVGPFLLASGRYVVRTWQSPLHKKRWERWFGTPKPQLVPEPAQQAQQAPRTAAAPQAQGMASPDLG